MKIASDYLKGSVHHYLPEPDICSHQLILFILQEKKEGNFVHYLEIFAVLTVSDKRG